MVALVTRRAARDLFDAHRIIAMPDLDWTKIKVATLMIGAGAKSFDWHTASPGAIGCEVGDITGKLTMCLPDRYFEAFGGPAGWIESVTAECREKLAPLFQLTAGEKAFLDVVLDRVEIDVSPLDVARARSDRSLSSFAMESSERQSVEIRRQSNGSTHQTKRRQ